MSKNLKTLIAVGGTGGHVIPGLSLASHLAEKNFKIKITTDKRGYNYIKGFENYESIRSVLDNYDNNVKYTTEKNNSKYDVIIGPLENTEANNLVSYFISKGYKETEILIE